jgi:DNA-binding NtrC family response regulator
MSARPVSPSSITVLVVDDEADMVATYQRLLRRQGHRVIAAITCREALDVVKAEALGLVVADLRLPDGSGLDVVRAAQERTTPPPVVIVTGHASPASRQQALAAGAAAYLPKPFAIEAFVGLVNGLLEEHA